MGIDIVVKQLAILFITMGIGYLTSKIKLLSEDTNKLISKLIIYVTMPCTILNSVMNGSVNSTTSDALIFVAIAFATFAVSIALSFFVPQLLHCGKEDRGIYRFAMVFGNASYMGIPVISAILGPRAIFYLAIANIPISILTYTLGILLVSGKSTKIRPREILNPCLFAAFIILIIFLTNFKTPKIIADTTQLIGAITTPGAMLAIGSTLATVPFLEVITKWRLHVVAVVKLFIVPAAAWLILRPFVSNALIFNVAILIAAMPTAANATLLAFQFGSDEKLGSSLVFITTLLSAISIPIVTLLFVIA